MPRDFDVARREREAADRSFVIGGKTFSYRPAVAPEAIMGWTEFAGSADQESAQLRASQASLAAAYAQQKAVEANGADPAELARVAADIASRTADVASKSAEVEAATRSEAEWLKVIDETIAAILEPRYHDDWAAIRDPNLDHPLSLADLQDLMEWLIEQVVNRPTGPPSSSSPSDGTTETPSTDASSSPAAPASDPSPSPSS